MLKIKRLLRPYYYKIRLLIETENRIKLKESYEYIHSLRNIHAGERCFIIGNGPSLSPNDLNKLKSEICFGSNRIFEIFDKTDWRPTYYFAQDNVLLETIKTEISKMIKCDKFIGLNAVSKNPTISGAYYINILPEDSYPYLPMYSDDISKKCYDGCTITYSCIQMATYMGFTDIILLGVDHSYSKIRNPDGTVTKQDVQDHFSEQDILGNIPLLYQSTLSYEAAKQYADAHGIKIYNATRGGKLEVFERVDFDTLFN